MYKCSNCGNLYRTSEKNNDLIHVKSPVEHVIKCPHCGDESHVIGAEIDYFMYGTEDKPVYLMYGRDKREGDENLQIIKGIKA